jgi:transposase
VSQKSRLAEAIRYALSRWTGLRLFLEDGRIERKRPLGCTFLRWA